MNRNNCYNSNNFSSNYFCVNTRVHYGLLTISKHIHTCFAQVIDEK